MTRGLFVASSCDEFEPARERRCRSHERGYVNASAGLHAAGDPARPAVGHRTLRGRVRLLEDDDDGRKRLEASLRSPSFRMSPYGGPYRFLSIWPSAELRDTSATFAIDGERGRNAGHRALRPHARRGRAVAQGGARCTSPESS